MIRELIKSYERIRERLKGLDETIAGVVDKRTDVILSLNRDQMLLGRNASGDLFTPGYLNDPYFDTPAQARAYAAMKERLLPSHNARIENPTIYPSKPSDTPNLRVTGPFQDSMFIMAGGDSFTIGSTYVDAPDIERKYNNDVFGLAPSSSMFFYEHYIKPALERLLKITLK